MIFRCIWSRKALASVSTCQHSAALVGHQTHFGKQAVSLRHRSKLISLVKDHLYLEKRENCRFTCLYSACAETWEIQSRACILPVFGKSAWVSQCLIHSRYSAYLEMSLVKCCSWNRDHGIFLCSGHRCVPGALASASWSHSKMDLF